VGSGLGMEELKSVDRVAREADPVKATAYPRRGMVKGKDTQQTADLLIFDLACTPRDVSAPQASPSPSASTGPAATLGAQDGLARGVWEAPRSAFYAVAAVIVVFAGVYGAFRLRRSNVRPRATHDPVTRR
jgi:hypothetical protein